MASGSQTRDRIQPAVEARSLNYWTSREVPHFCFKVKLIGSAARLSRIISCFKPCGPDIKDITHTGEQACGWLDWVIELQPLQVDISLDHPGTQLSSPSSSPTSLLLLKFHPYLSSFQKQGSQQTNILADPQSSLLRTVHTRLVVVELSWNWTIVTQTQCHYYRVQGALSLDGVLTLGRLQLDPWRN